MANNNENDNNNNVNLVNEQIVFDHHEANWGVEYTIGKLGPDRPTYLYVSFLAQQDYFSVDIPNLRRVHNDPDYFEYVSGETRIEIYMNINEQGQIDQASISVRSPNFRLWRDFAEFDVDEEVELIQEINNGLQREAARVQARARGRNVAAFRQTLGNQRPVGNTATGANWYYGPVPSNPAPILLGEPHGPGSLIASFLTGVPGTAAQQAATLQGAAQRKSRKNRKHK